MNNRLLKQVLLVLAVLGLLLILVSALADFFNIGSQGFGAWQTAGSLLGLSAMLVAYWSYRWTTIGLTSRDLPVAILTIAVFVGFPLILITVVNLSKDIERNRQLLTDIDNHLKFVSASARCAPASPTPAAAVTLKPIVGGLSKPLYVTHANDQSGRLFVVEKPGTIRIVKDGVLLSEPFLDIRDRVISDESIPAGDVEQGLLSVAFHPEYRSNGRFFVNYTAIGSEHTKVVEYRVTNNANIAAHDSERIILEIAQPYSQHNGGQLQFGPDGHLYIGVGDGGYSEGEGFRKDDPHNLAQDLTTLLGKILRIDVDSESPYIVPLDNPFIERAGARPEVYAYGFRNPWRFSFDPCDGSLFAGDVGRSNWEEIDLVFSGGNYGWKLMEGAHCFPPDTQCDIVGLQLPLFKYGHLGADQKGGNSVIGGYVYRGQKIPELIGYYLFSDFVSGRLWALGEAGTNRWRRHELLDVDFPVSSFGEGEARELYILDYNGKLYQLTKRANP